jgi:S1-C subfamily serine protease
MNSEKDMIEKIEAYLSGELNPEERAAFEKLREENFELDHRVIAHSQFLKQISEVAERRALIAQMNAIHESLDVEELKREVLPAVPFIKSIWSKYRINISVAASVAIVSVLLTMLVSGYFSSTKSNYSALRRKLDIEINNLKKSQNAIIKNIKGRVSPQVLNPGKFGGTGFALSENGYILTNYHVIKGADSIYIQNTGGESFKAKVVLQDPAYDLAVLQVTDPEFKLGSLPYTLKSTESELGEDVFTMGFPKDSIVYTKGYVSSNNGFSGDTLQYQVAIPVNPGNSGGPLLDSKGNVIGIISGKQTLSDGAAFAVKSSYLLKSLESVSKDSLETEIVLSKKNFLSGLSRRDQIKKLKNYTFMVKVY